VRWAFVLIIAGAILYSMIRTSSGIYLQQENRYKAVANYLLPRMKGHETVFVWGYTSAMRWYLGDGVEIEGGFNSSRFEGDYREADYIVVDPLMPSKWPDDPLNAYLQSSKAAYNEQAIGGFSLYIRRRSVVYRLKPEIADFGSGGLASVPWLLPPCGQGNGPKDRPRGPGPRRS